MKTFESTEPDVSPGAQFSTHIHPIQSFQWADYSAKPDHSYTYTIIPLYGKPSSLCDGGQVSVSVTTESESGNVHSVFFNRGAIASQEYARRFDNRRPDDPSFGNAAYKWLSRGLLEAFQAFVGRAEGPEFGLFGAIYEFQWPDALKAFKSAKDSGATVRIIYDAIAGDGPGEKNKDAIRDLHMSRYCQARTEGKIMHNKFVVLTKNGKPIAVWTGSTNLTENGIFGHLNCGHVVEEASVAAPYLDYWKKLEEDPESATERDWVATVNPVPPNPWDRDVSPVYSPRRGLEVLQWYAGIAGNSEKALFMTFPFGMHKKFQAVYERADRVLRFALMEKEGNGAGLAQGKIDIARIRGLPNVIVAIGKSIRINSFDRWLKERRALAAGLHVNYVHTKFMLVDPLGDKPVVVTGSANFSESSTNENDENMLVIRNEPRVADIYLGEFMRVYSHYAFREAVADHPGEQWTPSHLVESDTWQEDYFEEGTSRSLRRRYFSGA